MAQPYQSIFRPDLFVGQVIFVTGGGSGLGRCTAHELASLGGAIVNMLADIWTGYPGLSHMSAARAGIENMALSMTLEWAEHDVRVNCVAPGTILSSGMVTYPAAVQQQSVDAVGTLPAGRLGTESEVSAAVVFLLSPAANHVRGETIRIDGGESQQKGRFWKITRPGGTAAYDGFPLRPDFSGTPFETLMQPKDED